MPSRLPLGRWVSNTDHALAFSQQFAVNEIVGQLTSRAGLIAVNGPPGTGKTTMLRDLIAAIVVERAQRLAALSTPGEAFTGTRLHKWNAGRVSHAIVTPRQSLTGFEIVVASANNSAVENVTTEIPGPKGIGSQWRHRADGLDYFASTAELTCGKGAWGLVAARLGNAANRRAFDSERERRAQAITAAEETCRKIITSQRALDGLRDEAQTRRDHAMNRLDEHRRAKPGLIISISTRFRAARAWREESRTVLSAYQASVNELAATQCDVSDLRNRLETARRESRRARGEIVRLNGEAEGLRAQIRSARDRWGPHLPDGPEYTETQREELIARRELSAPWADAEFTAARTELFIAALEVHKAFIAAQASAIRRNLGALADILDGSKGRPSPSAARAAWQTFFLVVPVVSSAFASIGRLFACFGRESLGWMLIDEAGQAAPQLAAGAIWRARRTVVVGDPIQLEPVVTLPWGGQQALLREYQVAEEWAPGRTSVQGLADRLARYGTWLPAVMPDGPGHVWVGTPLRVHRRCDRPIFAISNRIAYDGLMVYGTQPRNAFRGHDVWCDIRSSVASGHWIPAEGQALREILDRLKQAGVSPDQIRVLSPFRQVAASAKTEYSKVFPEVTWQDRDQWVGTVHVMQGREADVVILILGSHPDRPGPRNWAAATPNLLNVAVSRARRRLYVIGDRQAWCTLRYFDTLAEALPVWPPDHGRPA